MTSQHLIITADDFGMCESVNRAVEECLAAGAMRATCVMMNMLAWAEASFLRVKFPAASVGIHWNLTQGRPVLPASEVPSLVGPEGRFHTLLELRRRWIAHRVKLTEVGAELQAQYERFYGLAGVPDFWNTHENFHVFPGLFGACVKLGEMLKIPAMRCHRRITVPCNDTVAFYNLRHPLYWFKGQVIAWWAARAESGGVLMPDGAVDMPGFDVGKRAVEDAMRRVQWARIKKAVELVIHPATTIEPELFGPLTESRVQEYEFFKDPGLKNRLGQLGIKVVGFDVL